MSDIDEQMTGIRGVMNHIASWSNRQIDRDALLNDPRVIVGLRHEAAMFEATLAEARQEVTKTSLNRLELKPLRPGIYAVESGGLLKSSWSAFVFALADELHQALIQLAAYRNWHYAEQFAAKIANVDWQFVGGELDAELDWLKENSSSTPAAPSDAKPVTWQQAKRFAEAHLARNPWPGLNVMATLVGCSPSTMSKARDSSEDLRKAEDDYNQSRKPPKPSQLADSRSDRLTKDGDVSEVVAVDELFNRVIAVETDPKRRATLENMTPQQRRELVSVVESDPDGESWFDTANPPAVRERSR